MRLSRTSLPGSAPKRRVRRARVPMSSQVMTMPTTIPAIASQRKLPMASAQENAPVRAAAAAMRKATSPLASLNRASPSRMVRMRPGMRTRCEIASSATGSVGETMAAMAKATGSGTAGIIQWIR